MKLVAKVIRKVNQLSYLDAVLVQMEVDINCRLRCGLSGV